MCPCRVAAEEYDVVASSYRLAGGNSDKLFFTMVDFDEGHDVFNAVRLKVVLTYGRFAVLTIFCLAQSEQCSYIHACSSARETEGC